MTGVREAGPVGVCRDEPAGVHDGAPAVAFRTLGCKVNRVESDAIAVQLMGSGCTVVEEAHAAVVIVNTCTVTGEADSKARKAVRQALALPREPIVVVTGCLAAVDATAVEALGDRVIVEPDKERVAAQVAAALGGVWISGAAPAIGVGEGFHTRATIKVQDGCDNRCAYCIVPDARGVPRSVPAARVVSEVTTLAEAGVAEVVLTGINIGRYCDEGVDISGLVRRVAAAGPLRVRLSSIEPPDVTDALLDVMGEYADVVCPHLHVPLQSGSDRVLAEMGRRYDTAEFTRRIFAARAAIPGLAVTTDVIAGLPGEDDEAARDTLRVCEDVGFARMHVFRYSPRPGTPAAERTDQTPSAVKSARAATLRSLDARLRSRYVDSRTGTTGELLVERIADGIAEGTTRDYLKMRIPAAEGTRVGDVIEVTVTREAVTG